VVTRRLVNIRISDAAREAIQRRAKDEDLSESEWARRALRYALGNMPKGWNPDK
jgi:hypothetical protein